jgi:hypothetical protein
VSVDDFETIGGLVSHQHGRVPRRGEAVDMGGLRFTVMIARGGAVRWFRVLAPARAGGGRRHRLKTLAALGCGSLPWPQRWVRCRRWRFSTPRPGPAAADPGLAGVAAGLGAPALRGLAGLVLRRGLAVCRRVVALHQHASLRWLAFAAGGGWGAVSGRGAVAVPGGGLRGLRTLAARPRVRRRAVCRVVAAGRTGAWWADAELPMGGIGVRAGGFAAGRPGTLGGGVWHGRGAGLGGGAGRARPGRTQSAAGQRRRGPLAPGPCRRHWLPWWPAASVTPMAFTQPAGS